MDQVKIAKVLIARGPEANLPAAFELGRLYLTTDTHKLFAGQGLTQSLVQITGNNAGLNFRGAWSLVTTYPQNDLVTFNNTLYIALNGNVGEQPDLFPADWETIVTGNALSTFIFTQSIPAATWIIPHNLGIHPSVIVEDSTNTQVLVETHFDSGNQVSVLFTGPESGMATCIA